MNKKQKLVGLMVLVGLILVIVLVCILTSSSTSSATPNAGLFRGMTLVTPTQRPATTPTPKPADVMEASSQPAFSDNESQVPTSHTEASGKYHYESCDYCNGLGYEECSFCGGDGKEDCFGCSGRCTERCISCSGTGKISDLVGFDLKKVRCPDCGGKGSINCVICNGKGYETCTFCEGHGRTDCIFCENGKVLVYD